MVILSRFTFFGDTLWKMKHSFSATQQSHAGQRNSAELVLLNLILLAFYDLIFSHHCHGLSLHPDPEEHQWLQPKTLLLYKGALPHHQ